MYFSKSFIPILKNSVGKVVDITDGLIDNIMDTAYQRKLFTQWLEINGVDIDLIFARQLVPSIPDNFDISEISLKAF